MPNVALFRAQLHDGFLEPLAHNRFVGRERELNRLEEILTKRKSATVLLAGFRGAGKTALMNEAIRRADTDKKQVVVRIAPPHLNQGSDAPSIRSQVLRSLARGLYFQALEVDGVSKDALSLISATYEKTYLTELEKHRVVESAAASANAERQSTVVRTSIDVSASVRMLVGGLVVALIGTLGVGVAVWASDRLGNGWGIAAAVFVVMLAVAGGLMFERTRKDETDTISKLMEKDGRTELGKFDLSDETLEFELRRSLAELADEGRRVIFVLDELDKLHWDGDEPSGIEDSPVFAILTSLKNFFMLGNAVYIFITDNEFFERVSLEQRSGSYALSHTIFSDRIYVGPLHYSELEDLIDRSIREKPAVKDYDRFQNFVCWESKNHAFDAIQVLGAFVENHNQKAVLAPTQSGEIDGVWQEGSLPSDWLTKAALQKHVGVAYGEARRSGQGEALYNRSLWESLHAVAVTLLESKTVAVAEEGILDLPGRFIDSLPADDVIGVSDAVQRMLLRMERHRAVQEEAGEDESEYDDTNTEIFKTRQAQCYRLASDVAYPPSTIASESVLLPSEQTLIESMNRLETAVKLSRDITTLTENQMQMLSRLQAIAKEVKQTGPRKAQKRFIVLKAIAEAGELAEAVVQRAITGVVKEWASSFGGVVNIGLHSTCPRSGQAWVNVLSQDFSPFITKLQKLDIEPLIVGGNANENGIVMLPLVDDGNAVALQKIYGQCLSADQNTRDERKQRLPVVHIDIKTGKGTRFPTEMIAVISEVQPTGWWGQFGSQPPSKKSKRSTRLTGWSHFDLEGTLSNINELPILLNKVSFVGSQE
ncbi:MAG: AAA family ATPase [Acidimicrobiia bacterium]|nr:AAA family ATPase [Acidimicrobiia bacterium]